MTASVTHAAHGARLASAESVCRGTSLTQTDRQTDRRLCAISHCGLGPKGGTAALGGPSDFQAAATPSRTCAARYGLSPWGGRCSVAASARREEDGSEGPSHVTGPRVESRARRRWKPHFPACHPELRLLRPRGSKGPGASGHPLSGPSAHLEREQAGRVGSGAGGCPHGSAQARLPAAEWAAWPLQPGPPGLPADTCLDSFPGCGLFPTESD